MNKQSGDTHPHACPIIFSEGNSLQDLPEIPNNNKDLVANNSWLPILTAPRRLHNTSFKSSDIPVCRVASTAECTQQLNVDRYVQTNLKTGWLRKDKDRSRLKLDFKTEGNHLIEELLVWDEATAMWIHSGNRRGLHETLHAEGIGGAYREQEKAPPCVLEFSAFMIPSKVGELRALPEGYTLDQEDWNMLA